MDPLLMVGGWATAIAATIGAGHLIVRLFVKAVRAALFEQTQGFKDDLETLEEWWVERLEQIEDRLDRIDRELRPNGGASLRDTVDRLEKWANSQT